MNGVVLVVVGVLFALPLLGVQVGDATLRSSMGPPLVALVLAIVVLVVRSRGQRTAVARARQALASDLPPVPVRLRTEWCGSPEQVRNRMVLHRTDTGLDVGVAPVASPGGVFDPRGPLWAHGALEPGGAVALTGDDGRSPLLSIGPVAALDAGGPIAVHPSSDTINRLLGWDAEPTAPAPLLAPDLAAAARRVLARQRRGGVAVVAAVALLPSICAILRPGLALTCALTAVVWAACIAYAQRAGGWVRRPVADVLEASGHPPADARFLAAALTAMRFGLGLPADPAAAVAAPAPPETAPASGWGYAPQAAPPAPPEPTRPGPWSSEPSDLGSPRTVSLLVGLALVVIGALVFASTGAAFPEAAPGLGLVAVGLVVVVVGPHVPLGGRRD